MQEVRLGKKIHFRDKVVFGLISGIITIILGIISGVYSKCGVRGARGRGEGKEERGEKSKINFSW